MSLRSPDPAARALALALALALAVVLAGVPCVVRAAPPDDGDPCGLAPLGAGGAVGPGRGVRGPPGRDVAPGVAPGLLGAPTCPWSGRDHGRPVPDTSLLPLVRRGVPGRLRLLGGGLDPTGRLSRGGALCLRAGALAALRRGRAHRDRARQGRDGPQGHHQAHTPETALRPRHALPGADPLLQQDARSAHRCR